jgi:hypothetical protein
VLHALEVLGVVDQPLVDALPVASTTGLDLLHVGIGLPLRPVQVLDPGPGLADPGLEPLLGAGERDELGGLRQVLELVAELVEPGVQLLQVQQPQLVGGVGFQRLLLFRCGVSPRGTTMGR